MIQALRIFCGVVAVAALVVAAAIDLDHRYPPNLDRVASVGAEILDRHGIVLRAFTAADGRWRFAVRPEAVSPRYLDLLLMAEDQRFHVHPGIDPLAVMRAAMQAATHGRVVSGASTLTMQVARLLEPRPRTFGAKLQDMLRALQLEAHFTKREVLTLYLQLAPMGGGVEGVRAGSRVWFGKEPERLSTAEAALLVALPQAPERLRPDHGGGVMLRAARARILARGLATGVIDLAEAAAAEVAPLPEISFAMPFLAPHLTGHLRSATPGPVLGTTLDAGMQSRLERVGRQFRDRLAPEVDLAVIVAEHGTRAVRAWLGSADYLAPRRPGMIDLARAVRSPGSTLKPIVYGLAFERLLAHPRSLVADAPTRFGDYAPENSAGGFSGEVTVATALQQSLNLPAVMMLERIGPNVVLERLAEVGLPLVQGQGGAPGLPLVLGGIGTRLVDLVAAYGAIAQGGTVVPLHVVNGGEIAAPDRLLDAGAAAEVARILAGVPPPLGAGAAAGRIAYKTGTSHRFRDGWAVGFDGRHVIGVWIGRADGASCAGCAGAIAAELLFRVLDTLPRHPLQLPAAVAPFDGPAPPALARLERAGDALAEPARPRIGFPLDGTTLLVDAASGAVELRGEGGHRPYRWLVDGAPLSTAAWRAQAAWRPSGAGFAEITLIDAAGRSSTAAVRVALRQSAPAP